MGDIAEIVSFNWWIFDLPNNMKRLIASKHFTLSINKNVMMDLFMVTNGKVMRSI